MYDENFNKVVIEDTNVDRDGNKLPEHPMQPIYVDQNNVARFRENKIISYLTRQITDLNTLAIRGITEKWSNEDWEQLMQLIGYSVSGFGDLSYCRDHIVAKADQEADRIWTEKNPKDEKNG